MAEISQRAKDIVDKGYQIYVDPNSDLGQQIDAYTIQKDQNRYKNNPYMATPISSASPTTNVSSISSESLTGTPDISGQITTPQVSQPYPVAGLNAEPPELPMLPQEVQGDVISQRLQDLNNQLIGQSAYRTQKETEAGIPALQKTQTDLSSRLKALQNEALAVPLRIEEESIGRGRTRQGIAPLVASDLRKNAIEALTVSSLLEASRGNLLLAQNQVERAVSQRFDPIREEIEAKQANLKLILGSPSYGREEKNRALKTQAILDAQKAQLESQKENQQAVWNLAVKAASTGIDVSILNRIQNAKTPQEALQIATQFGVFAPQDKILSIAEAKALGVPFGTTQSEAYGITPTSGTDTGSKILSPSEAALLGVPYGTTQSQAAGQGIIPVTGQSGIEATRTRENALSGLRALETVKSEIDRGGRILLTKAALPFSPGARTFATASREVADVITRLRTGAALNVNEEKFYRKQLPNVLDSEATIKYKTQLLQDLFNRLSGQQRNIQSINVSGTSKDSDYLKSLGF